MDMAAMKEAVTDAHTVLYCNNQASKDEECAAAAVEAEDDGRGLLYGVTDVPPLGIIISTALQHILMGLGSALSVAYVICDVICAGQDHPIRAKLFCTTLLMTGVCTVMQPLIGSRLPLYQGVCTTFLVPLLAMKNSPRWRCAAPRSHVINDSLASNVTTMAVDTSDVEMYIKLREMMGCLMLASLLEVLAGATGLVGLLLNYIGPLTIATVISLIGMALVKIPIEYSRVHWPLAALCILSCLVMMLYMEKIQLPVLIGCPRPNGPKPFRKMPVFQMFPILLSVLVTWLVSGIMTSVGALPDDPLALAYRARTDVRLNMIRETPWFYVPYPGQFGTPLFNTTLFVGFISAVISSILETLGDYVAAAATCDIPPPPTHAVNRGVMMEGIGSVLSGALGAGHATTSYTTNIALIGISRVASRSALVTAGLISVALSLIGKLGAVMASLPDPCIGGSMFIIFGILCSIGVFTLRHVDMTSSRNLSIFGIALYTGIVIPGWLERYPDAFGDNPGAAVDILKGIMGQPMLMGGLVAFILDNTVRGTFKERGLHTRRIERKMSTDVTYMRSKLQTEKLYNIPCLNRILVQFPALQRLPFSPKFDTTCTTLGNGVRKT